MNDLICYERFRIKWKFKSKGHTIESDQTRERTAGAKNEMKTNKNVTSPTSVNGLLEIHAESERRELGNSVDLLPYRSIHDNVNLPSFMPSAPNTRYGLYLFTIWRKLL